MQKPMCGEQYFCVKFASFTWAFAMAFTEILVSPDVPAALDGSGATEVTDAAADDGGTAELRGAADDAMTLGDEGALARTDVAAEDADIDDECSSRICAALLWFACSTSSTFMIIPFPSMVAVTAPVTRTR